MRFNDKFRFALHNIWNSKSRNFLTILIVFIVSMLILVIGLSCINIASNMDAATKLYAEKNGASFSLNSLYNHNPGGASTTRPITDEEHKLVMDALADTLYCSSVVATGGNFNILFKGDDNNNTYFNEIAMYDYNYGFIKDATALAQGRVWDKHDANTAGIYIAKPLLDTINKSGAAAYGAGSTIPISLTVYGDKSGGGRDEETLDFKILGILDYNLVEGEKTDSYSRPGLIVDFSYIKSLVTTLSISGIAYNFFLPNISYDINKMYSNMSKITKEINSKLDLGASGYDRFNNSLVNELKMSTIMNLVIIGLGLVLGFIVLLLSIGSVSNTIIISIDKNRRFTGLMMAMGMKHKHVKSIVRMESTITIFLGILLSTCLCFALIPVFQNVLGGIFGSLMYYADAIGYKFKFTLPIYFPLGVATVFALMAMLFTRGGLRKLGKLDPITVISEVS